MTRLTPAPGGTTLGAAQTRRVSNARSATAVTVSYCTTVPTPYIAPSPYRRLVPMDVWDLDTLLDAHVAPALACPACCPPQWLCGCPAGR